jgi:hypothetical protein
MPPQTAALPRDPKSKMPVFFLMQPPAGRPIKFLHRGLSAVADGGM